VRRWKPFSRWQLQPTLIEAITSCLTLLMITSLLGLYIVCLYQLRKSDAAILWGLILSTHLCYWLWPVGLNLEMYSITWQMLKRMTTEDVISNA